MYVSSHFNLELQLTIAAQLDVPALKASCEGDARFFGLSDSWNSMQYEKLKSREADYTG